MQIDIIQLLMDNPSLCLFLVIGLGYLLGNVSIGSARLGPMAGVLLAGLVFGHYGFAIPERVKEIGFILFIYSVGLQAGPRFFSVFFKDGFKYAAMAGVTAAAAISVTIGCTYLIDFSPGLSAGLMAGSMTSSPLLAAAQDAVQSGLAQPHSGQSVAQAMGEVSVGYAITYLFGLLGVLTAMRLLPKVMGFDLRAEAAKLAKERRMTDDDEEAGRDNRPMIRAFEVDDQTIVGRRLDELGMSRDLGCVIQHIKREGKLITPDSDTELSMGDRVSVVGPGERLENLEGKIGPGVFDTELLSPPVDSIVVIVTHPDAVGKPIGELHTLARYGCYITRIVRSQIELPISMDVVLEKGDAVRISGLRERLNALVKRMGYEERRVIQTDLLTFALGIVLGLLLGKITLKAGAVALGMGAAGGLLLSGIFIGFLRSIHPTFGRVPPAARWVFMELGMVLFIAGVGLEAGGGIIEALKAVGLPLFLSGAAVTTAAMATGLFFGRYVLKLHPALLFGALAGSMTSTPALSVVTQSVDHPIPALGYAGAYPFANLFMAMGGTLLMYL
ncbi:MAG: transporter [Desulfovibrio sp.]|nr:MAG: transporter [Desulfovibrio sp.]